MSLEDKAAAVGNRRLLPGRDEKMSSSSTTKTTTTFEDEDDADDDGARGSTADCRLRWSTRMLPTGCDGGTYKNRRRRQRPLSTKSYTKTENVFCQMSTATTTTMSRTTTTTTTTREDKSTGCCQDWVDDEEILLHANSSIQTTFVAALPVDDSRLSTGQPPTEPEPVVENALQDASPKADWPFNHEACQP